MSANNKIYVVQTGLITPLGWCAKSSAAAVNAGVSAIRETAILNKRLKPVKMALVPDGALPPLHPLLFKSRIPARQLRLLRLASAAIAQLIKFLPESPVPLYLALPECLPGKSQSVVGNVIEQLSLQSGVSIDNERSLVAEVGRSGVLYAIKHAQEYLAITGQDYLLVGGVDTYWDPGLIAKLDFEDRLMVQDNADGFFPGEAASFMLLASERVKDQLPKPWVSLNHPGLAKETGHFYSDETYRGDGLASAVTKALEPLESKFVDAIWTSMIYDSYCSKELGVALTRNNARISSSVKMNHPVDCIGDVGAAIGGTLISLLAVNASKVSSGTRHLLCCSSDLSHRAALLVEVQREEV